MTRKIVYAIIAVAFAMPVSGADTPSPYAPLAFLAGNCWKGALSGGKDIDTHCFSWVYGDKFVRDVHTVHGDGHKDYVGESIYYWDSAAKQLRFLYIENAGGASTGVVDAADMAIVFPEANYQENGSTQTYRSRWTRAGADAYDVVTEFKKGGDWTTGWTVHMEKVAATQTK